MESRNPIYSTSQSFQDRLIKELALKKGPRKTGSRPRIKLRKRISNGSDEEN